MKVAKQTDDLLCPTRYGGFAPDGTSYVITDPNTPRPWINYLTNGDYCALCSHVAGGYSFYKDHRFHSVLRRGQNQSLDDLPGRFIYLKDETTGETWNANVHPIGKFDRFEARHGVGYTTLSTSYAGVDAEMKFFVPMGMDVEMWEIGLTNRSRKTRRLSVYSFAEFLLGNVSLIQHEPFYQGIFHDFGWKGSDLVASHKFWFTEAWSEVCEPWPLRAFMTTTQRPTAVLADRAMFLGGLGSYAKPKALESELLPKGAPTPRDIAGVNQWRITLKPGETWSTKVAIGVQPNRESRANDRQLAALKKPATYAAAWKKTEKHWADLFGAVEVTTPESEINVMMNVWNKLQMMVNFYYGRAPSYYHKSQHPAMRDCCQDAFGVLPLRPALARENLRRIARFFYADGQACSGCNRIGLKDKPSVKVDLPLWFVLAVADYIRETGELDFLDEIFPYMDEGESSVYEKMCIGIERMINLRGPHGLPLIGRGDWNDPANAIGAKGRGESVWLAQFVCLVISEIAPFMEHKKDVKRLAGYQKRAVELKKIINDSCWDGQWFVRSFRDDGRPVGVKGQKEGFIWINSQTWAVIGQCADADRLNSCMDAVEQHLGTPYGLMNLAPAYGKFDPSIGRITAFRAGWKENGAIFSHASSFNIVARAMLGRGKDALDLYRRILPMGKAPDQYLMEPYVYSQFCAGPAAGHEMGQGAYHWLTGTAAWMFRAMTDYIIGVRAELHGLRIRPVVDPAWKHFTLRRRFRGCDYRFEFHNPDGIETGVKQILLDGKPIAGDFLPLPTRRVHRVVVRMG